MAGTPKFDRTQVLLSAARQFAQRGFEGASISHLVDATGLLRGSLYGSFGSKSELFRLAFGEAATEPFQDQDLVLDLIVVALRERSMYDNEVSDIARSILRSLDKSGGAASEQIYWRLLERAGLVIDPATDSPQPTEASHE